MASLREYHWMSSMNETQAPAPKAQIPWKRALTELAIALALVIAAVMVGRTTDLQRKAALDFGGARIEGTVEPVDEPRTHRLTFEGPGGAIHSRRYEGSLGWQGWWGDTETMTMVYHPDDPARFQPLGVSHAPGALALLLFSTGFVVVMRARYRLLAPLRQSRRQPPSSPPKSKGSGQ